MHRLCFWHSCWAVERNATFYHFHRVGCWHHRHNPLGTISVSEYTQAYSALVHGGVVWYCCTVTIHCPVHAFQLFLKEQQLLPDPLTFCRSPRLHWSASMPHPTVHALYTFRRELYRALLPAIRSLVLVTALRCVTCRVCE